MKRCQMKIIVQRTIQDAPRNHVKLSSEKARANTTPNKEDRKKQVPRKRNSHLGFRSTIITESPRRNILLINLSLFTGSAFFFPFPVFGT